MPEAENKGLAPMRGDHCVIFTKQIKGLWDSFNSPSI